MRKDLEELVEESTEEQPEVTQEGIPEAPLEEITNETIVQRLDEPEEEPGK